MLKSVLPLSFIVGSRFFGIFIILPVISLYALDLRGANEFLVGLLVGVYAVTQMIFQVPFGALSDRIGRKKTVALGLAVFIAGSLICAAASDIYTMLLGRLIQGAGAIGAAATAMISDFTSEEKRGKAMAIMGGFIGLSFSLSMILSPVISQNFGLSSLFYLSAALSALCIVLLYAVVPAEPKISHFEEKVPFKKLVLEKNFMLMNVTNMMQKMLTSIAFLAIPIVLVHSLGYAQSELWKVYAVSTALGFIVMGLGGALGDGRGLGKKMLLIGIALFIAAYGVFCAASSALVYAAGVAIFFVGFNLHEPILQSLATKFVKTKQRGAALGAFNSFGYLGSFVGGIFGGYMLQNYDFYALGVICIIACVIWFIALLSLKDPREYKNLYFNKIADGGLNFSALEGLNGIFDRYENGGNIVVKFDSVLTSEDKIREILARR